MSSSSQSQRGAAGRLGEERGAAETSGGLGRRGMVLGTGARAEGTGDGGAWRGGGEMVTDLSF